MQRHVADYHDRAFKFGVFSVFLWLIIGLFVAPTPIYQDTIAVPTKLTLYSAKNTSAHHQVTFNNQRYPIETVFDYGALKQAISNSKPITFTIINKAYYSPFDAASPHFSPFVIGINNPKANGERKWLYKISNIIAFPLLWALLLIIIEMTIIFPIKKLRNKQKLSFELYEYFLLGTSAAAFILPWLAMPILALLF